MTSARKPRRWKWFRRALGSVVGLLLGWVVAGVVQGEPKPATTEPALSPLVSPTFVPALDPVIIPSTAPMTQPTDTDDNLASIIPAPGQTGWLWPVCGGIVALFVVAAGVGIVSKSLRIKDPGEANQTKHH